jgi:coronin-7
VCLLCFYVYLYCTRAVFLTFCCCSRCVYVYVCLFVCVCVCMPVCVYVYMYVYIYMCVCVHVYNMCVCMCVFRNLRTVWASNSSADVVITTSTVGGNRQLSSWDPRNMSKALLTLKIDSQSGTLYPFYDEDTGMCVVGGKGDSTFRIFELSLPGVAEDGKFACAKSTEISTGGGPIAGMCLLPKTQCNVKEVEVNRILKLTTSQVTPVSLILPRADNLKEFFQDDVYPPTRSRTSAAASVSEWVADSTLGDVPVYESLQPPNMELLSKRTVAEVKVTKAQEFRNVIDQKQDENKKREETFQRLQELAIQRSKFHPNASGGEGGHGFKVDATPVHDANDDDSDDGWSD